MSVESPYTKEFAVLRIVVLIEDAPFSNKYHQVALTMQQLNSIMNTMYAILPTNGQNMRFKMLNTEIKLPDETQSFTP